MLTILFLLFMFGVAIRGGTFSALFGRSGDEEGPTAHRVAEEETPGAVTGSGDADDPPAGPTGMAASDGAGRSEAGAVAAAMRFATASQAWVYMTDADIEAAATAVVAPSSRERLVNEVVDEVRLLRDQLQEAKGTVWYVVSPLATKVDSYSESRAVVRVWLVRVLSADGVAVPQSGWETLALELVWDRGWRVADVDHAEGPTPQLEAGLQPWSAAYLDQTLAGFLRVTTR